MQSINSLSPLILPFDSELADLITAGGKGANLVRLVRAGLPVPEGFVIPVAAYQAFVAENNLAAGIQDALTKVERAGLDEVSAQIRSLFTAAPFPALLADAIQTACYGLDLRAVAVRSSATAEDLPDLSFAGQQDTLLNVVGTQAIQEAVVKCWSSLWTARAIGYRMRNRIDQRDIALAVVIQRMVESQVSGVLFTANPLTGLRSEMVIDAAYGLGEAVVSGKVEPDQYIYDPTEGRIRAKTMGRKAVSIHADAEGGTGETHADRSALQALPDEQIHALARLAGEAAALFGSPQDIEWACSGDTLYLLQSRPITSLYPLPAGLDAEPLKVFFSFGAVQGLLDPLTPLGVDALKKIFAAGAGLFGYQVDGQTQTVLYTAGERLWINFTSVVSSALGRRLIGDVMGLLEPTIGQALEEIWDDPHLQPRRSSLSMQARLRLARFFAPLAFNVALNLLVPAPRRRLIINKGERIIADLRQEIDAMQGDCRINLVRKSKLLDETAIRGISTMLILFISAIAAGMASWNLVRLLNPKRGHSGENGENGWNRLLLELTRGMPHNPTTEMDLALWEIARSTRADEVVSHLLVDKEPRLLAAAWLDGKLPPLLQGQMNRFLQVYGGRGLGEIDLGRPRWAEDPTHVFEMLASFAQISDPGGAPDVVFARGQASAQAAANELVRLARAGSAGWLRAPLVRFLTGRARAWMGLRERPKFFAVRLMAVIREALLVSGSSLTGPELEVPGDMVYLTLAEIGAFAAGENRGWSALIKSRRQAAERERLRRQIPRLLLSDGRAFYGGLRSRDPGAIHGSPVSPGRASGRVRVVLDPSHAGLLPGEVLVCPGTDPSWTPLFLSASALVMEVGGMMTHGAVVAREYGIPSVVGVDQATARLQTGMLIEVDGSSGQIEILAQPGDPDPSAAAGPEPILSTASNQETPTADPQGYAADGAVLPDA